MLLYMLSFGVLSWHEPSRWHFKVIISRWKIGKSDTVIAPEIERLLR